MTNAEVPDQIPDQDLTHEQAPRREPTPTEALTTVVGRLFAGVDLKEPHTVYRYFEGRKDHVVAITNDPATGGYQVMNNVGDRNSLNTGGPDKGPTLFEGTLVDGVLRTTHMNRQELPQKEGAESDDEWAGRLLEQLALGTIKPLSRLQWGFMVAKAARTAAKAEKRAKQQ